MKYLQFVLHQTKIILFLAQMINLLRFLISNLDNKSIISKVLEKVLTPYYFCNISNPSIIGFISSIAVSPDGSFMICGYRNKMIKIFDLVTTHKVNHFREVHQGIFFDFFIKNLPSLIKVQSMRLPSVQMETSLHHVQMMVRLKSLICKPNKNIITLKMLMMVRIDFNSSLIIQNRCNLFNSIQSQR